MRLKILKKLSAGTLIFQTILSIFIVTGLHGMVFAQTASQSFNVTSYLSAEKQKQSYFSTSNPIGSFIVQIVNFLALTIGSLCFLAIVVGGFVLLTSHGNANQVTKGQDIIKAALIGLVVVLMAYYITAFVQSLFYEKPG